MYNDIVWISLDRHGILAVVWILAHSVEYMCALATYAPCIPIHVIIYRGYPLAQCHYLD